MKRYSCVEPMTSATRASTHAASSADRRHATPRSSVSRLAGLLLAIGAASGGNLPAQQVHAGSVYYSFEGPRSGFARLDVDAQTGAIEAHRTLFAAEDLTAPRKLALSADGSFAALICETDRGVNLIVVGQGDAEGVVHRMTLPERPEEIRAFGHRFLVGGNDGPVWVVDAERGAVAAVWNSRRDLIPSGRQPEDIHVLPGGRRALVSFQKDSRGGRHFGSRLVAFDLAPEFRFRFDLPLPRNRPDLHYPRERNLREQGPNPEVIFVSTATNTVAVTLDLYGAVAMFDLDAAWERGQLDNLRYETTSLDGSWGTAFPDRGLHFTRDGRDYLLIANAGPAAGAVLFDLQTREIIERYGTGTGLEYPVFLPGAALIAAAPNGKIKDRGPDGLTKRYAPAPELYLWDVRELTAEGGARLHREPMPRYVYRAAAVAPDRSNLVVLVTGEEAPITLIVYDPVRRAAVTELPALGSVQRVLLQPGR